MSNLLRNGDFETEWGVEQSHHCLANWSGNAWSEVDIGNIFTPPGWVTWFKHREGKYAQPEVRDAWADMDPRRVRNGFKGMLFFTFWKRHNGGFLQQVQVQPGARYRLTAYAHAWSNGYEGGPHNDEPDWSEGAGRQVVAWPAQLPSTTGNQQEDGKANFVFEVGLDPTGGQDPFGDSVVYGPGWHIYNGYCQQLSVECTATGPLMTVFLHSRTLFSYKHNDAYWDDVCLERIDAAPEPEPEPEPGVRGQPRVQYARTVNVYPAGTTRDRATEIAGFAFDAGRQTVTGSYDDAGVGDLDSRTAILWDIPQTERQAFLDFYAQYYPGVTVRFAGAGNSTGTSTWLLSQSDPRWREVLFGGLDCGRTVGAQGCFITCLAMAQRIFGIDPDATPLTVDAALKATGHGYSQCLARWDAIEEALGLSITSGTEAQVRAALANGGLALAEVAPATFQHFVLVYAVKPEGFVMLDPWRNVDRLLGAVYDGVDSWRILTKKADAPEPEPPTGAFNPRSLGLHLQTMVAGALDYVQECKPSCVKRVQGAQDLITLHALNPGMACVYRAFPSGATPEEHVAQNLDTLRQVCDAGVNLYFESVNEVYGGDRASNTRWRDWELEFMDRLATAEPRCKPVVFCAAVGNPPEDQYDLLVPLARAATDAGGALGYHGYWGANPAWSSLDDYETHGRWLQYRFEMMDDYLTARGVYPRWFLGETGVVEATPLPTGGYQFGPYDGWRSKTCLNGDWSRYLAQLEQFAQHIWEWNLDHWGRCIGGVLFTSGQGTGWESFQLAAAQFASIRDMQVRKWPA